MQPKICLSILLTLMVSSPFLINADITYCSSNTFFFFGTNPVGNPIGDINGDKIEDLAFGDSMFNVLYVVLGRRTRFPSTLNLGSATSTDGVIRLTGTTGFGISFGPVGDINNDGYGDFIVGNYMECKAYVFYGKSSWSDMTVRTDFVSGTHGFKISNSSCGGLVMGSFGNYVSLAGDVNGDGKNDLLLSGFFPTTNFYYFYVIFGATSMTDIDVSTMPKSVGIKIGGSRSRMVGSTAAVGADLNHDGNTDLILGAPQSSEAFVIFGGPGLNDDINLGTMSATAGIRISSSSSGVQFGGTLANVHDINDDGVDDFLISGNQVGQAYLVYGKSNLTSINVDTMTSTDGIKIIKDPADTGNRNQNLGRALIYAEDINLDGKPDAFVSSIYRTYVIYGGSTLNSQSSITYSTTSAQIMEETTDVARSYPFATFLADVSGDGVKEYYYIASQGTFRLVRGYTTTSGGTCYPCSESCLSCTDANTCTACAQGKTPFGFNCSCTSAQYFSTTTYTCTACSTLDASCTACSDANTCTACSGGKVPSGGSNCIACSTLDSSCTACSDANTCTACSGGKTPFNKTCNCTASQYLSNGQCTACPATCKKCNDAVTCTECIDDYVLVNSACVIPDNSLKGWQIGLIATGSTVISGAVIFAIWKMIALKVLGSKTKVVAMKATKISVATNP